MALCWACAGPVLGHALQDAASAGTKHVERCSGSVIGFHLAHVLQDAYSAGTKQDKRCAGSVLGLFWVHALQLQDAASTAHRRVLRTCAGGLP